jgi:hypothetical protein
LLLRKKTKNARHAAIIIIGAVFTSPSVSEVSTAVASVPLGISSGHGAGHPPGGSLQLAAAVLPRQRFEFWPDKDVRVFGVPRVESLPAC